MSDRIILVPHLMRRDCPLRKRVCFVSKLHFADSEKVFEVTAMCVKSGWYMSIRHRGGLKIEPRKLIVGLWIHDVEVTKKTGSLRALLANNNQWAPCMCSTFYDLTKKRVKRTTGVFEDNQQHFLAQTLWEILCPCTLVTSEDYT